MYISDSDKRKHFELSVKVSVHLTFIHRLVLESFGFRHCHAHNTTIILTVNWKILQFWFVVKTGARYFALKYRSKLTNHIRGYFHTWDARKAQTVLKFFSGCIVEDLIMLMRFSCFERIAVIGYSFTKCPISSICRCNT